MTLTLLKEGQVSRLLSESERLVERIAVVAEPYKAFMETIRAGGPAEALGTRFGGPVAAPALAVGGLGEIESVHFTASEWSRAEVVEGLLLLSELRGFESPQLGRTLAGGAYLAALSTSGSVDTRTELTLRTLIAIGLWNRIVSGFSVETFANVLRAEVPGVRGQVLRCLAYALADVGDDIGARRSARAARGGSSTRPHDEGRNALAQAYVLARSGDFPGAVEWHREALSKLDPEESFVLAWQTAVNTIHLLASLEEAAVAADDAESYAGRVAACSPYPSGLPDASLKWGLGRVLFRACEPEKARVLLTEASSGFRRALLQEERTSSLFDLAILEIAECNQAAVETILRELGDDPSYAVLRVLADLRFTGKTKKVDPSIVGAATGLSLCSLVM